MLTLPLPCDQTGQTQGFRGHQLSSVPMVNSGNLVNGCFECAESTALGRNPTGPREAPHHGQAHAGTRVGGRPLLSPPATVEKMLPALGAPAPPLRGEAHTLGSIWSDFIFSLFPLCATLGSFRDHSSWFSGPFQDPHPLHYPLDPTYSDLVLELLRLLPQLVELTHLRPRRWSVPPREPQVCNRDSTAH